VNIDLLDYEFAAGVGLAAVGTLAGLTVAGLIDWLKTRNSDKDGG